MTTQQKITDATISPRAAEQYADAEQARTCPQCHESRMSEWDPALRLFFCNVCSETWKPRRCAS